MQVKDLELAQILLPKPGDFFIFVDPLEFQTKNTQPPENVTKAAKYWKAETAGVFALREIAFEDPHSWGFNLWLFDVHGWVGTCLPADSKWPFWDG